MLRAAGWEQDVGELIRRLQYSPSNRRHEVTHDAFGIVTAIKYGSRCAHMYDRVRTQVLDRLREQTVAQSIDSRS